ncbi:hypothetical protein FRX31_028682 [Thalictrum thalictroides]|uniref:Uncharacterized protein n=1 Tax=Thalictrum thalictroides TaxID=46969 RepID=A0A7J6VAT1_THATH|nr:hypothetical protein FRX31_028682 [Thalictrum thalictroides]
MANQNSHRPKFKDCTKPDITIMDQQTKVDVYHMSVKHQVRLRNQSSVVAARSENVYFHQNGPQIRVTEKIMASIWREM